MGMYDGNDRPDAPADDPTRPPNTAEAWSAEEDAAAQQWADQYIAQHQISSSWGTRDDLINNYRAQRRAGVSHDQALATVPHLLGWDVAAPGPGGGGGGGGTNLYPGWTGHPPPLPDDPTAPTPGRYDPHAFVGPTAADLLRDPSYQFRFDQGQRSIEASAAAKGMLNGSGTLKDLLGYGQDFASQEYKNVWDRDFTSWQGNELARFKATEGNNAADLNAYDRNISNSRFKYNASYDQWMALYNQWRNNQNDDWGRRRDVAFA